MRVPSRNDFCQLFFLGKRKEMFLFTVVPKRNKHKLLDTTRNNQKQINQGLKGWTGVGRDIGVRWGLGSRAGLVRASQPK